MDSSLSSSFRLHTSPFLSSPKPSAAFPSFPPKLTPFSSSSTPTSSIRASSSPPPPPSSSHKTPFLRAIQKSAAAAALLLATAVSFPGNPPHSMADTIPPAALSEQQADEELQPSPLPEFLEANPDSVETLKNLLQTKLENKEYEESLALLKRMTAAQPSEVEWKFLLARLHGEMGDAKNARDVFEEILKMNPLSFEALFENALLMDKYGEREAVLGRLEDSLKVAEDENKSKEARDVRLIMAQMKFLQKDVDGALRSYQELAKEDPVDFRPYFCQGMIYSLLDRNEEAREQFAKYRELSPRKFEVDGYLRTSLSRMKLFGTDESN